MRLQATLGASGGSLVVGAATLGLYQLTESAVLALLGTLACGAAIALIVDRLMRRNLAAVETLVEAAEAVRDGSLERLAVLDGANLGAFEGLGISFRALFDFFGSVSRRVLDTMGDVQELPARLTIAMEQIEASAGAQEEAVEETASLLANMNSSIRGIDQRVEDLSRAAEESASSILQMGSSVDEVARNAASLHESVETSTSSVHEMGASIRQVAESAENVQRIAEDTAASMTEMDRTVQEVGRHTEEASALSAKVSAGADQGAEAVESTIRDIEDIHRLTSEARNGLGALVSRIDEIAEVLIVISAINDETNLLSLNAAIIAAQAGEQGRPFLVVANHVKTLAQRTASSTHDIERLIAAVQKESDLAVSAMGAGIEAIEQGVSRSRKAGQALVSIRRSATESSERVSEIARATAEQTKTSSLVARAAQDTSLQVQQISSAMSEQLTVSDQMLRNAEAALDLCRHVHRSTDEQKETGRYITESISSITEMIRLIQENTSTHTKASSSVSDAVMRLLDNSRQSAEQVPQVNAMLTELRTGAESIVGELGRLSPEK